MGLPPHFVRFRDAHGECLEGAGSRSSADPQAGQLENERANALFPLADLQDLGVPCSLNMEEDRSGAFLVWQSAGAHRLGAGHARATTGSIDLALPVPLAEWQDVWAQVV